jgi:CheY-like chemotaxis protein
VLLVDDDELALASTTGLLESWGCTVTATDTPETLLPALSQHNPPDMIVCDYRVGRRLSGLARSFRQLRQPISAWPGPGRHPQWRHLVGQPPAEMPSSAGIPLLHKPVRPARLRALLQRKTQG